jgi:hypothetical protein
LSSRSATALESSGRDADFGCSRFSRESQAWGIVISLNAKNANSLLSGDTIPRQQSI